MQIITKPTVTYVVELTESELSDALVDAKPLQESLRAARNQQRIAASADHSNPHRSSGATPAAIAAAAKKQTAKNKRPFLSDDDATPKIEIPRVVCPECGKMVVDSPKGWGIHKARSHQTRVAMGNTFPISAQNVD